MTWTPVVNDTFVRANTTPSANPGSVGNGWIDVLGSLFGINTNRLFGTVSNFNAFSGQLLVRQASENAISQRIAATSTFTTPGTTPRPSALARVQDGMNMYIAQLSNTGGGTLHLSKMVAGAVTDFATSTVVPATAGHSYTMDLSVIGSSPTALSVTLTDNNTASSVTLTGSDSTAGLQIAGPVGIDVWAVTNGTATTIYYTDIETFSYSSATNTMGIVPVTTQASNYTFALTDAGQVVDYTGSAAGVFTIAPNSTINFALYTVLAMRYTGTGAVTGAAGTGVTIDGNVAPAKYQTVFYHQIATDVWVCGS